MGRSFGFRIPVLGGKGHALVLPRLEPHPTRSIYLASCAPDGMPFIGRARGRGDAWLAAGHQMIGLKASLGTARLLGELMTGVTPSFDSEPFRADRY